MNKVICDVCGTDYPETASQCPICGTANAGGGQTSAGNTVETEESTYSPTRGGHFSRNNVRKRMKASANQQPVLPMSSRGVDEDEDDGFDEDELEGVSNKGLVVIVVLLLLAIIAVSSYIVVTFFADKDPKDPAQTTGSSQSQTDDLTDPSGSESTEPSESKPVVDRIPCTGLSVAEPELVLVTKEPMQIKLTVQPADTTDAISYQSSNEAVATVDANGRVKAVSNGKATITVTCGDQKVEITVQCQLEEPTDPTDPADPTVPGESTEPTVPSATVILELNREDFTLFSAGESWMLYKGELDPADITWSSSDEKVATVENGKVVAVGPGSAKIFAEYGDQKVFCYVRCSFEAPEPTDPSEEPTEPSDEPTDPSEEPTDPSEEPTDPSEEPTDPSEEPTAPSEEPADPSEESTAPSEEPTDPSEEPTDPSEESTAPSEEPVERTLLINNYLPNALFEERENSADVTLTLGMGTNIGDCTISISNTENVEWHNNDEAVCTFDPATGKVTALAKGRVLLTATVDGVEYIVCIRVVLP